jgi:hypothetical protein
MAGTFAGVCNAQQNDLNGQPLSGASERANADTQPLFIYAWQTYPDAICPVVGGRGASALADFNANKQITLLDMRGRTPFGLDDMGNAARGAFTSVPFSSGNATTGGSSAGTNGTTLSAAQIPAITSSVSVSVSGSISGSTTIGSGGVNVNSPNSTALNGSGNGPETFAVGGSFSGGGSGSASSNNTSGQPFPMVPSALLGTHFWKL